MTIEEFIRARLDEDERAVVAASVEYEGETWTAAGDSVNTITVSNIAATVEKTYSQGVAEHIARHDPARVLRQAGITRALVAGHTRDDWFEFADETTGSCKACSNYCPECRSLVRWPCGTLRLIASIWSDHPDYLPEWSA